MEAKTAEAENLRRQIEYLSNLIHDARQKEAVKPVKGNPQSYHKHDRREHLKPFIQKKPVVNQLPTHKPVLKDNSAKFSWKSQQTCLKSTSTVPYTRVRNENNQNKEKDNSFTDKYEKCDTISVPSISLIGQERVKMPVHLNPETLQKGNTELPHSSVIKCREKSIHKDKAKLTMVHENSESIKKELLKTQLKIAELKKSLSERQPLVGSPVKSPLRSDIYHSVIGKNSDMLALSPYKLKRVCSDSAISTSNLKNTDYRTKLTETKPVNITGETLPAKPLRHSSDNKSDSATNNSHSSTMSNDQTPDSKTGSAHSCLDKPASSKIVKNTRYSLKRVRCSSGSAKKSSMAEDESKTPSKFVSLSKYCLKRVRRSLSDEKTMDKTSLSVPSSQSAARQAANMIIGKYRMFKSPSVGAGSFARNRKTNSYQDASYYYSTPVHNHNHHHNSRSEQFLRGSPNRFKSRGKAYTYKYRNSGRKPHWKYQQQGSAFYHQKQKFYLKHQSAHHHQKKVEYMKKTVPFHPRMRLDRRNVQDPNDNGMSRHSGFVHKSGKHLDNSTLPLAGRCRQEKSNVKFLNSTSSKTVVVNGVKFKMNRDGTTLRKVETDMKVLRTSQFNSRMQSYRQSLPGSLYRFPSTYSRRKALQFVNRTLHRRAVKTRQSVQKTKEYCMFYNRFGRCNRGEKCTYIHDPEKIAVCTRFLRGTCKVSDCPFSHKVAREKMPVCSYFLKGRCHKEDCPYLHVNVNKDAEVCPQFVKGFCPLGEKCKKKHTLECQEFRKTGSCPRGRKCTLQHRRDKEKVVIIVKADQSQSDEPSTLDEMTSGDDFGSDSCLATADDGQCVEFKDQLLPAYISLNLGRKEMIPVADSSLTFLKKEPVQLEKKKDDPQMKIRPQFGESKKI